MFIGDEVTKFAQISPATVITIITPKQRGRVRWRATDWFAEFERPDCAMTALPGQTVGVVGRRGITLLVVPIRLDRDMR